MNPSPESCTQGSSFEDERHQHVNTSFTPRRVGRTLTRGRPQSWYLGYWLHPAAIGGGIATRATAAMMTEAFTLSNVTYLEIAHDASNVSSSAIPRRLGFSEVRREQVTPPAAPSDSGIDVIWRLNRPTPPVGQRHSLPLTARPVLNSNRFGPKRDDLSRGRAAGFQWLKSPTTLPGPSGVSSGRTKATWVRSWSCLRSNTLISSRRSRREDRAFSPVPWHHAELVR
ncbi:GNAT family N-acetyltransferase [Streptomyces sp. WM6372]|uniref:GNAT family N-acetyltransferase n=1 Tax=Streptomyces sp. WM6372 TaxID=1415555 RepID=UPI001F309BC0|nr:GNAT family N-acetyltransferase [Streptomyces sp. WM6372]